jgi:1A family penicillin-binding protein
MMVLLEIIIKILKGIGTPIVWLIKRISLFFKKFFEYVLNLSKKTKKLKLIKVKWHKFKLPKISLPKIKIPKFKLPRFGFRLKKIKNSWIILGLILIVFSLIGNWSYQNIIKDFPDINLIYSPPNMSTVITDRNGEVLYKFYEDENRTWIPLKDIPQDLIKATIAIEDKNFYHHHGISFKGIINAIRYNFAKSGEDKPRGGSTITQQLVKNVFLSNEKTLSRKIKEGFLTILLEQKMSKDEILERYLNQVSYGGEAYGAQEAAQKYFGKDLKDITTLEAAYLAGLPAAPSSYSPYGSNPELGMLRAKHVIEEMVSIGYLNSIQAEEKLSEKIQVKTNNRQIKAPHFVFYIKKLLEEKYGYKNIEKQGLTIKTSLDIKVQDEAQKVVMEEIAKVKKLNINNGAALILDVKNGDILAMVGSKDYWATDIDGKYNVSMALRQPGSSIKPINYLLALEKGWSVASTIEDSPITYQIKGQKSYSPQNYNGKYMGRVTLRTALASSLNIPSVKLLNSNGVENMIDLAQKLGITSWEDRSRFGLSLALGSGEVKMTEISQAYSTLANLGEEIKINPILEIYNYLGERIYSKEIQKERKVEAGYTYILNDVLSDNQARTPIFGNHSKLVIKDKTVAVKTGTTNDLKDNWCIGWTPTYLTAVWVGNNDNQPMSWVASGVSGATPIWNRIMTDLLTDKENEKWELPNNLIKQNICGKDEWVVEGSQIKVSCITPQPTETP